jgi:hypothetical protein
MAIRLIGEILQSHARTFLQYLESFFRAEFLLYRVDELLKNQKAIAGVPDCNNDIGCRVVCSPAVVRWEVGCGAERIASAMTSADLANACLLRSARE